MPKKTYPTDVIEQAQVIAQAWAQIDPNLTFGELSQPALVEKLSMVMPIENEIISMEAKLTDMRNQRDAYLQDLWEHAKRGRMGMKVIYGDDSSQYEMVGGTRRSERKPVTRRTTTTE